jgi:hypothetical protein
MTGDQEDMANRLRAVLPAQWFADSSPVLEGVLAGLAATASWAWTLLQTVSAQTRLATASGSFLDIAAQDFFGNRLQRGPGQADAAFRAAIGRELLRERGTRGAVVSVLTDLTGRAPFVFEPARPADTGAWGVALGYGAGGAWGSLALPFQCFVTAYRPSGSGIAALADVSGQVTDSDITSAIAGVMPVASIAWTRITD